MLKQVTKTMFIHQSFGNVSFRDRQEWFDSR